MLVGTPSQTVPLLPCLVFLRLRAYEYSDDDADAFAKSADQLLHQRPGLSFEVDFHDQGRGAPLIDELQSKFPGRVTEVTIPDCVSLAEIFWDNADEDDTDFPHMYEKPSSNVLRRLRVLPAPPQTVYVRYTGSHMEFVQQP